MAELTLDVSELPRKIRHQLNWWLTTKSLILRWWRNVLDRLVFPIPPGPRIIILGDSWPIEPRVSANSDSRPLNILGFAGNVENEFELNPR